MMRIVLWLGEKGGLAGIHDEGGRDGRGRSGKGVGDKRRAQKACCKKNMSTTN